MRNKLETAFPLDRSVHIDGRPVIGIGLTKREYFAGLAMQGLSASIASDARANIELITQDAVKMADALLEALEE